ncbi:MAG: LLM class flavin-dependent oxidoreductase [Proteobacteria bacterium]|nr:LLM class flavin-dependent oxidoreductase [Pseudomonadota bacterium]
MNRPERVHFGHTVAPVDRVGADDAALYRECLIDCEFGQALGYDGAWFLEHHFTDYFPTPSPMLFMAYAAARVPGLSLGTAVLVTPWYHPLRFAEEVAMLSLLSERPLHLGIGRGTAKLEYDAWGVDMEEARERFAECLEITRLAHAGEPFQFEGKHFRMGRKVPMRPAPRTERINFYGAIGSPNSAEIMADLDLPPLVVANFPLHVQTRVIEAWENRTRARGGRLDRDRPIMVQAWIADTDAEAQALVRRWAPPYFDLQARHYQPDENAYQDIKSYEQFAKFFGNLKRMADPEQMGPWIDLQFVGTPATVRRQVQVYIDIGFNRFIIQVATYGVPRAVRHEMLRRFATDVAPEFSDRFRNGKTVRRTSETKGGIAP